MSDSQANKQYIKMTQTPVTKLLATLSIPTIISMLVTNVYNMVDTAFVGKLGTSASGATGILFGFMAILQAVGFLFGQGAGSLMSRQLGSKNKEEASRIGSTGTFLAFSLSIIVAIICLIFIEPLVYMLGSTVTIAPYAMDYAKYILISAPFIVTSFTLNNLLRYEGKAYLGMIGLFVGALLNIGGDPLFMFVFNMGISGAGLSTCLSQVVSFCILLSFFLRGKTQCVLSFKNVSFQLPRIGNIVATGLPSLLRQGLQSLSTIVLNMLANPYGDPAISALSIVSRVVFFVFSVALGIGQGFQPISSFNYGAKKYDRVKKAFWSAVIMGEVLIATATVIVLFNVTPILTFLRDDPAVIEIGKKALVLQILSQLASPFSTVTEMSLQSTGKRFLASLMSSLKSGIIFIPVVYLFATLWKLNGIIYSQPFCNIVILIPSAIFAIWFFKKLKEEEASDNK